MAASIHWHAVDADWHRRTALPGRVHTKSVPPHVNILLLRQTSSFTPDHLPRPATHPATKGTLC
eukprot:352542-Chlamydomonas_euryale.AAC.6